jgi:hypothetical protein
MCVLLSMCVYCVVYRGVSSVAVSAGRRFTWFQVGMCYLSGDLVGVPRLVEKCTNVYGF